MAEPTTYSDPNLAAVEICLAADTDIDYAGEFTNAATLLVRADQLVPDESGQHPGELFAQVTLQRGEVLDLLQALEDDWQDHCRFADPLADARPMLTRQVSGQIDVVLDLLARAADVIETIEPEDDAEAHELEKLTGHMRAAIDELSEDD